MDKLSQYLLNLLAAALTSILTTCGIIRNPLPVGDMICDKSSKEVFYSCLIENVPLGSSYEELKNFMILHGFGYSNDDPDPEKNNRFLFLWNSNGLDNYKFWVDGHCDNDMKVIDIKVK